MAVELYDEHEQSERVRGWLRENGGSIVLGVVLALAAIFGWRQWEGYQNDQKILADEYHSAVRSELSAGNVEQALSQYQTMREAVGRQGYVPLAAMAVAASLTEEGRVEDAAKILSDLLDDGNWPTLEPLLKLRLAILESALDKNESALALIEGAPAEGYEGLWLETRGDVLMDLGRLENAANAYAEAVEQLRGAGRDFRQAEVKMQTAKSAATAEEAV